MKRIEAIIRPEKVQVVKEALIEMGHAGLTVYDVQGHGTQKGISQQWRGQEYSVDLLPKVKIEAVVPDTLKDRTIETIIAVARTGTIGDGKIFVSKVDEAIRIRNDERGEIAL